jgi:hypothetical protein
VIGTPQTSAYPDCHEPQTPATVMKASLTGTSAALWQLPSHVFLCFAGRRGVDRQLQKVRVMNPEGCDPVTISTAHPYTTIDSCFKERDSDSVCYASAQSSSLGRWIAPMGDVANRQAG